MRILIASRNFFPAGVVGGAQTSIKYLAGHLIARGHEVAVVSVDDVGSVGRHAATDLPEYRLKIRNLSRAGGRTPSGKAMWHFVDRYAGAMRGPLVETLEDFKPDVVMSNVMAGMTLSLWDAAAALGVPVVHMVHDYYLLCVKSGMRKQNHNCATSCGVCSFVASKVSRRKSQAVGDVIYVSNHVRQVHEAQGIFPAPIRAHVEHGPYRPAVSAEQIAADRAARRARPGTTFGFFGRVTPDKGVLQLIETLQPLAGDWRLVIGGDGPPEFLAQLRAAIGDSPIELLGVRSPDEFFGMIDVLIVPSLWHDPAPRVVYEAGAHGVVSIVSDRGGLPELVGHGTRGFVYDAARPETLQAIVREVMADPAVLDDKIARWAEAAPQFTVEGFGDAVEAILVAAANAPREAAVNRA